MNPPLNPSADYGHGERIEQGGFKVKKVRQVNFTIEVGKMDRREQFSFEDLQLFHRECYGGELLGEYPYGSIEIELGRLSCCRCEMEAELSREDRVKIRLTAIDGEERAKPGRHCGSKGAWGTTSVNIGSGDEANRPSALCSRTSSNRHSGHPTTCLSAGETGRRLWEKGKQIRRDDDYIAPKRW